MDTNETTRSSVVVSIKPAPQISLTYYGQLYDLPTSTLAMVYQYQSSLLSQGLTDVVTFADTERAIIAKQEGIVCGAILWEETEDNEFWVNLVYVSKPERGQGVFRKMFQHLIDLAEEVHIARIVVGTAHSNVSMQVALEKLKAKPKHILYHYQVEPE